MSGAGIAQALGWLAVSWLTVVHLLVERGRLPRNGLAFRVAGCAAAASVVLAAVVTRFWPMAALGLLWLRTEVFAHRDEVPVPVPPKAVRARPSRSNPVHQLGRMVQPAMTWLLRIEILVIVIVLLVLLGHWTKQHNADFNQRSDHVLCGLLRGTC